MVTDGSKLEEIEERNTEKRALLKNLKVGDEVACDGDSGFCDYSVEKISNITVKYDEDSGEPYNVIWLGERMFDSRDGWAMNPPTAYYIMPVTK